MDADKKPNPSRPAGEHAQGNERTDRRGSQGSQPRRKNTTGGESDRPAPGSSSSWQDELRKRLGDVPWRRISSSSEGK